MKLSKKARDRKKAIAILREQTRKLVGDPCKSWCPGCLSCEMWWMVAKLDVMFPDDERKPCKKHIK